MKKLKLFIVPILILFVFGGLLMQKVLSDERQLPNKNWSRDISFPINSEEKETPLVVSDGQHITVYIKNKQALSVLETDDNFQIFKQRKIPINLTKYDPYTVIDSNIFFISNKTLTFSDSEGKTKEIEKNVDGLANLSGNLVYWRNNEIYRLDQTTLSGKKIGSAKHPIQNIVAGNNPNIFLMVEKTDDYIYLTVLQKNGGQYEQKQLVKLTLPYNALLDGFNFVVHDQTMLITYYQFGSTHGGTYRNNYLVSFNLKKYKVDSKTVKLDVVDNETGLTFSTMNDLQINWINDQPVLLFSGIGPFYGGKEAQNIYLARQSHGQWQAQKISNTKNPSSKPVWMNNHAVLWNEFDGHSYILKGSSQNESIIQKSLHLKKEDWSDAMSTSLTQLAISLLIFGYALVWVIPASLFIIGLSMGNMTLMERNPRWIAVTAAVLFVITQLIFIQRLFNGKLQTFGPGYLHFAGASYVIPVIVALFAWFLTEWVKNKDWGNIQFISYFLLTDVLMIGFLVGPYTL